MISSGEWVARVATRESAVRRCPWLNSAISAAANIPCCAGPGLTSGALPTWARHLLSGTLASPRLTLSRPATHSVPSSWVFHSAASTPPGASTRAISGNARSMSNQ
jgi:hypothetical protein